MYDYAFLGMIWVAGTTFVFSGLVKLDDSIGFSYKIEEYLRVAPGRLRYFFQPFIPYTLLLAGCMATVEVILGVALLAQYCLFYTLSALLLLTFFFVGLTFYTAVSKKIKHCGCFGNGIVLTPWQSFAKSLILFLLLSLSLSYMPLQTVSPYGHYWIGIAFVGSLALWSYTVHYLPVLGLEPYHVGSRLGHLAKPQESERYLYIIEIDGKRIETQDETRISEGKLIKQHLLYSPRTPIEAAFTVWQGSKVMTDELLSGTRLLIILQQPKRISDADILQLQALQLSLPNHIQAALLTLEDEGKDLAATLGLPLYISTPILLQTMMRATAGFLLLDQGSVTRKWHFRRLSHLIRHFSQKPL